MYSPISLVCHISVSFLYKNWITFTHKVGLLVIQSLPNIVYNDIFKKNGDTALKSYVYWIKVKIPDAAVTSVIKE